MLSPDDNALVRPQSTADDEVSTFLQLEEEAQRLAKAGHECPVPKPRGVLGELLGFVNRGDAPTPTTTPVQQVGESQ